MPPQVASGLRFKLPLFCSRNRQTLDGVLYFGQRFGVILVQRERRAYRCDAALLRQNSAKLLPSRLEICCEARLLFNTHFWKNNPVTPRRYLHEDRNFIQALKSKRRDQGFSIDQQRIAAEKAIEKISVIMI